MIKEISINYGFDLQKEKAFVLKGGMETRNEQASELTGFSFGNIHSESYHTQATIRPQ